MQTSRLTSTLQRGQPPDPAARLVLTTAGSNCGVMPTAMARENSTESISVRCSSTLVTRMSAASTPATCISSIEKRRSPIWKSVSGARVPSPAAMRPNSERGPAATDDARCRRRR